MIFACACLSAGWAFGQSSDDDKGYLTTLIEDNLSGAGRSVEIVGFTGALSSEATIEQMTIADSEGIWLTLEDVVLTWNRSALLRGAIDVEQLRAEQITVARAPIGEDTGPSPEAQPFSLPELPVSVNLDTLQIDNITLAPVFLGEEVSFSLTGEAELAGGEGAANITATRLGEKRGVFEIAGAYANETRELDLLLRLDEGPDGIAARLIDLPGRPAVRLEVAGDAPLSDFTATLALATDGEDRLSGTFATVEQDSGQRITVDLGGDVSPLFAPAYRGFFGDDASLQAEVIRGADGSVDIPLLALDAGRLTLDGTLAIDESGWPSLINLTGGITPLGDQPVLLPLSGAETFVEGLDIAVTYDVAVSDDWRADIVLEGLAQTGLRVETINLTGGGLIRPPQPGETPAFSARMRYAAEGVAFDDAAAQTAFGDRVEGLFVASREGGSTTEISTLTLNGAGLEVEAQAVIAGASRGFETEATLTAGIEGLGRFSTLVGRPLGGAASVDVVVSATPLDGLFDVSLDGVTRDLSVGIAQIDPVLAGQGDIALRAVRDTAGTRLEDLTVRTLQARLQASGALTSNGGEGDFNARLSDLALVLPELAGPATLTGDVSQDDAGVIRFDVVAQAAESEIATQGFVTSDGTGPIIDATAQAVISDLTRFAELADSPLAGRVDLDLEGRVDTESLRFDLSVTGETRDIETGFARIDPFLAGRSTITGAVQRVADDRFVLADLAVITPSARLIGAADVDLDGSNTADLRFTVNDAAMLEPSLSGPMIIALEATPAPDDATAAQLSVNGAGADVLADVIIASPANKREVSGTVTADVARLSAFADLAGRDLAGQLNLTASGSVLPDLSAFDAQVNLRSEDLQVGIPTVDPLLAGTGRINATVALEDGVLGVRTLEVSTREVSIVAALNGAQGFGQGRFNASLRNVGVLTDQISGPVRATGTASLDENGVWGIDATGTGPGGLGADIAGQIAPDGRLDIDIDGSAPLALANAALDPRRLSGQANFDLSVEGQPSLEAVSGRVTFDNGRLAAPTLGEALTDITGGITLTSGRAQIDLQSAVETGGSLSVSGPVALTPPNDADLTIRLNNVVVRDPELYRTEVNGGIEVDGPLQGGARITGTLNLGQTDVQVPSSSISGLGDLPDVSHIAPPADVRRTLARAGVLGGESGNGGGVTRRPYPLDLTINAPSRIFIRGRGLDAELGGSLNIGGTTADVIPVGRFTLVRGRIDILQQRFALTEGIATLQGDFEPFIRLVATTETETGTVINIIVEGPAGSPEVRFVSVPELPQDEVLAQLIFGRDLESISALQAVQLASAISTLAGRGGGTLDRFRAGLGLDDFDVTTDEEGNAAVRAGAYLSDNVYTDVTVTSEGETEINLNLDITNEITAKGSVDQDGETSVGIFFERDY
ncbi:translocation/assembly module TamB domain-containing protein [Yoonia litorea]|uniref:translocation/assembly module TamB domain-containing protein n=1 Tax=Yoonia litorea TaxID=1123755 RepID=UPI000B7E26AB|nr:translocation/assembly module TamB domain-containing protein [Yoonia litorea]